MTSNKTFQRLLSVLLFACMLLSLMPGFALAEAEIETAEEAIVEETAEAVEEVPAEEPVVEAVAEETVEAVVEEAAEAIEASVLEIDTAAFGDVAEPMRARVSLYANWPVDWPDHGIGSSTDGGYKGRVASSTYSSSGDSEYKEFCNTISNRSGLSEGYTLIGWDTVAKEPNADGPEYSLDFTTTQNLTLYAHWEAKGNVTYKDGAYGQLWDTYVIENVPAGSATPKLVYNEVEGDPTTIVLNGETYTFQGWTPAWNATMGTGNVTYTATWSPEIPAPRHNDPRLHDTWQSSLTSWLTNLKFTTKYTGSNGVERSFETVAFSSFNSDKAYSYSEVYGNDYNGYSVDVTVFFNDRIEAYVSSEVERVGGLSGYVIDKDKHPVLPLGDEEYPSLTFTLYAIFYSNGETYDDGTLKFKWWPFAPGALSADFSIENQSTLSSQGAGNRVIWMKAPAQTYTVTFTDGLDDVVAFEDFAVSVEEGTAWNEVFRQCPEIICSLAPGDYQLSDGRLFLGWECNIDEYCEAHPTVEEDVTFTALWDRWINVQYRIDGDCVLEDGYWLSLGEEAFPPCDDPTREGYTFAGWKSVVEQEYYGEYLVEDFCFPVSIAADTEYTVCAYQEEEGGYIEYVIFLDAQWANDSAEAVKLKGESLSLKGNIRLNYYLDLPEDCTEANGAYATFNGVRAPIGELTKNGYLFPYYVTAKEMQDEITLRIYDADGTPYRLLDREGNNITEEGYVYSAAAYFALARANAPENTALMNLIDRMSNYGMCAQIQFNHNAETAIITAEMQAEFDAMDASTVAAYIPTVPEAPVGGLTYDGASLLLKSGTYVRHYFTLSEGNIGDYRFLVKGVTVTPTLKDGQYYVEILDIPAKDLDTVYPVEVQNAAGETVMSIGNYSALSYVYRVLSSDAATADLQNLVKALYLYNQAANAYFGA